MVEELMNQFMLIDIWRQQHPTEKKYTYKKIQKVNPKYQASRLDFFLINQGLVHLAKIFIEPGVLSDHSLVICELQLNVQEKGSDIWRFNTSLLSDPSYVDFMNQKISETIASFHRERPDIKWEKLKEDIIVNSQQFSIKRANDDNKNNLKQLIAKLQNLENKISSVSDKLIQEEITTQMEKCKY